MTTFRIIFFYLLTQLHGPRVCVRTYYMLVWCSMLQTLNLICNMITLEKNVLTFWPHQEAKAVCKDGICACMVLYAPFPLFWYATRLLSEKMFWPDPRGWGFCKDRICACEVLYAAFPLIWYTAWLLSQFFLTFWPHPCGWGCVYYSNELKVLTRMRGRWGAIAKPLAKYFDPQQLSKA